VRLSPSVIDAVDAGAEKIRVKMSRAEIENSPLVDTADIEVIETMPPVMIL
jgi:hypothetical protein